MSEPFLAEIKMFGFNFAPRGWALCDGQILPIDQYQSLYSLLGTTYGGDGRTSFGLPDLRGRSPEHVSSTRALGSKAGAENVTLQIGQIPAHQHRVQANAAAGTVNVATGNFLAQAAFNTYGDYTAASPMFANSVGNTGGGQGHNNMQPWLALTFCIALQGLFPSRN